MTPSRQGPREALVRRIFDRIARRYDLLNRVISLRLDTHWRKKAVQSLPLDSGEALILDLGTGTGDLALAAAKELKGKIIGLDFSLEMLRLAQAKKRRSAYGERAHYVMGTALEPPFREASFDAVMTAFVLRNIPDLPFFFLQALRLLKPGGRLVSLDMFPPCGGPFAFFYSIYFYRLVPWLGAGLARDRRAYQYLSESVRGFFPPEAVAEMIQKAGFNTVETRKFLCGAVCLHVAKKSSTGRAQTQ